MLEYADGELVQIALGEQPGGVKKIQDEVLTHKVRLVEPFLNLSQEERKWDHVVQAISQ